MHFNSSAGSAAPVVPTRSAAPPSSSYPIPAGPFLCYGVVATKDRDLRYSSTRNIIPSKVQHPQPYSLPRYSSTRDLIHSKVSFTTYLRLTCDLLTTPYSLQSSGDAQETPGSVMGYFPAIQGEAHFLPKGQGWVAASCPGELLNLPSTVSPNISKTGLLPARPTNVCMAHSREPCFLAGSGNTGMEAGRGRPLWVLIDPWFKKCSALV